MRALNLISAFFSPGAGHFAAGRHRRGLVWIALFLVAAMSMLWLGLWPMCVVYVAQLVDVALLDEGDAQGALLQLLWPIACWVILIIGALLIRRFWSESFKIPSGSMIPGLELGDHIVASRWSFRPERGQTIAFRYPKEPDKDFLKRAIAIGGDTVELHDDVIVLNGQPVPRVHVDGDCSYRDLDEEKHWVERRCDAWDETLGDRTYRVIYDVPHQPRSTSPVTIPPGHTWVLGDNRDNSHDSRYWGTVPPELLRAAPRLIWYSEGRDGVRWSRINKRIR